MVNSVLSGDKEGEGGTGAGETSRYPQGRDTRGQAEGFVSDDFHGRSSKQDRDTREEELARDAYIEQVVCYPLLFTFADNELSETIVNQNLRTRNDLMIILETVIICS